MKCKHCQNELPKGTTLCPTCGGENPEAAQTGLSAGKIALLVVLAVAAIAVIVALVLGSGSGTNPAETTLPTEPAASTTPVATTPVATVPADGNPDDVTCKGSYTVTNDQIAAAASTVVATVGNKTLTNEQLQTYYWMQVIDFLNQHGAYASMFGMDVTKPLDVQVSMEGTMTWQQYFLQSALTNWNQYQVMCLEAEAAGFQLEQEYVDYLEELPANLEESALANGFESTEAMIQADMGPGSTLAGYMGYLYDYYQGYMFYGQTMENMEITDADIEAYFDAHAAEYQEKGLVKSDERYVDVRHILIQPTSASGASTYTEEEWAAAEAKANEVLNEWLTKNPDEDGFSVLAEAYSTDPGSASNGGLYENVYVGQMVPEFNDWCFDATRQYGDYGIVKTTYGYHIMYFVRSNLVWKLTAQQDLLVEKGDAFLKSAMEKYPAKIDYSAIALGYVNLGITG